MNTNIEEIDDITRVVEIDNMEQLIRVSKLSNLIIIDFSATWCGPCQDIKPYFKELSIIYKDCIFLSVDVDESQELSDFFEIQNLPTFAFIKHENIFYKLTGCQPEILKSKIEEFKYIMQESDDEKITPTDI